MLEILAPAGSKESFYAAINGGADAIYLGLDDFSARKSADNFTRDNLKEYLDYAHVLGVKVYVALNTLIKDEELNKLFSYLEFCNGAGVDGVIMQELFLAPYIKKRFPSLPLHLSTQAGVNNVDGALLAKEYGFERVVLSRETPIEDIKEISKIIETEVFIQGALCTSFSGQCYLSSFAGNKSGNRGLCKQPCRKKYRIIGGSEELNGYLISLSDLSVGHKIKDLADAGVSSFKIEGRMRKPAYVFAACEYYKDILEGKSPSISRLKRTFNRGGYTQGLAFKQDASFISSKVQSHLGEEIGVVLKTVGDKIEIKTNYNYLPKDGFKVLRNGYEVGNLICDGNGILRGSGDVKKGDIVTITSSTEDEKAPFENKKLLPVKVEAVLLTGRNPYFKASAKDSCVELSFDDILEPSKTKPLTKDELLENFSKTADYPFKVFVEAITDGVFIPKSKLNLFRRTLFEKLYKKLSFVEFRATYPLHIEKIEPKIEEEKKLLVISNDFNGAENLKMEAAIFAPDDYLDKKSFKKFFFDLKNNPCKKFLYLFGTYSSGDNRLIEGLLDNFDGIYTDGYYGVLLAKRLDKELILGSGANVYNDLALKEALTKAQYVVLSKELAYSQLKNKESAYYYALGSVKVMDLNYCPFGKNCADCKRANSFTLSDGERDFYLRRVKLNGCRFEVYNCAHLVTDYAGNKIINFVTLSPTERESAVKYIDEYEKTINIFKNVTKGHFKKTLE